MPYQYTYQGRSEEGAWDATPLLLEFTYTKAVHTLEELSPLVDD